MTLPLLKKIDYIYQTFYRKFLFFLKDHLGKPCKGSVASSLSSSLGNLVRVLGKDVMEVAGETWVVW
jgi:hypothetical protein